MCSTQTHTHTKKTEKKKEIRKSWVNEKLCGLQSDVLINNVIPRFHFIYLIYKIFAFILIEMGVKRAKKVEAINLLSEKEQKKCILFGQTEYL